MAHGDIQYTSLPHQEASDPTPSPPPSPLYSTSTITAGSPLRLLPTFAFTSPAAPAPSPPSISTTELFVELRGGRLLRHGFTDEQNRGIGHLLGIIDDVQRRHRNAYATEKERGWYFQPDAHRQVIRDHKIGDWMVVAQMYWEALCAVRRALGIRADDDEYGDGGRIGHMGLNINEIGNGNENGNGNADGNLHCRNRNADTDVDRDKRYERVVATLKEFIKTLTALKDKALKDKMQVNKQRYTHTGQWLNFLTIGAAVLLYVKNTFLAGSAAVAVASSNVTLYGSGQ